MMQMGGGTNARGAFENAKYVFDADFRPASRCVVFLTDGYVGICKLLSVINAFIVTVAMQFKLRVICVIW